MAFIVTVHVPVPVHAPDHPANVESVFAAAVNVTLVPELYEAEQVVPQLIPEGLLVTIPDPVPALVTDNKYCCVPTLKLFVPIKGSVPVFPLLSVAAAKYVCVPRE